MKSFKSAALAATFLSIFAGEGSAASYLDRTESAVYEVPGTHQDIARKGQTCIARIVRPGRVSAPVIVTADLEGGTIVANNAFQYAYGALLPVQYRARSTLTFQAKDGRFRIVNEGIEAFQDSQGWQPIGLWQFSGGETAKATIDGISASIAKCVISGGKADNW